VGTAEDGPEGATHLRRHGQLLQSHDELRLVQDAQHGLLAVVGRQEAGAHIKAPPPKGDLELAVLGNAALGDVHLRLDLEAGQHRILNSLGQGGSLLQHTIHPVARQHGPLRWLDVQVRGPVLHRLEQELIHDLDHREQLPLHPATVLGGSPDRVLDEVLDAPLLAVGLVDLGLDVVLGGRQHLHPQAGQALQLVQGGDVVDVAQGHLELAPLPLHRDGHQPSSHGLRDQLQDLRAEEDLGQIDGAHTPLFRQGAAEHLGRNEAELGEDLPQHGSSALLLPHGHLELALGDDAPVHEALPQHLAGGLRGGRGRCVHVGYGRGPVMPGGPARRCGIGLEEGSYPGRDRAVADWGSCNG